MGDAGDDQSDYEEISKEERIRRHHAKKATTFATREIFWLDYKPEPVRVREDSKSKGRTIKYLSNSQYTVGVVSFERTVKDPRVYTSCIKVHRRNLLKDKTINIVPGMLCKLGDDTFHIIHSIEVKLASPQQR